MSSKSSKFEQIIAEIEDYIDSCKFQPLSSTKIVVNKEEMVEMLRELRMKTPDEIERYQKIISSKDAIMEDARAKADGIINDAKAKAKKIIDNSEVMQCALEEANQVIEQTNAQAQEILDKAVADSNEIRLSAINYTDQMLSNLEQVMNNTIDAAGTKYNDFISTIQSCYDIVSKNRRELSPESIHSTDTDYFTDSNSGEGESVK